MLVAYVLYNKFILCKNRTTSEHKARVVLFMLHIFTAFRSSQNFAYILSYKPHVRTSQFRNAVGVRTCEVGALLTTLMRRSCNDAW
jgi:hypothetical protein